MLVELAVENYAVIEKVRVRFHPGLNLLTGETGSGKSIVVDALGLLLGGRASPEMVRTGATRARVSGIFEVADSPALAKLLEDAGIEIEDRELLVEREIQAGRKSRAFVCNRPATAALLKDLAAHLADIHGQHDQQQLFSPAVQCDMLDAFAGAVDLAGQVSEAFQAWKRAAVEREELDRSAQEKLRLADLWAFQRKEIEAVGPKPGEDADLENERRVLRNVVRLQELAGGAYAALYEDPSSASAQVGSIAKRLEELARIDDSAREMLAQLQPASIALAETAHSLHHYLGNLEADPARLDEVEDRLAALEKLKRKYGPSVEQVLAFLEEVSTNLSAVENADERRNALQKEVAGFAKGYETAAKKLSARRHEAAKELSKRVEQELSALAMEKTRVGIRVEPAEWSERGADTVAFLIAPNVGEELKPLDKIASGGELSRVALALKTCTSGAPKKNALPRTLVFDEVDAGVGGSAAESVGRRLKKLSGANQVICVTHLPQIAGFADHHYFVEKHSEGGRTLASIEELTPDARTREIGRMLSGERITQEALRHAEQLLKMAAK
ncbi:MAG: replication and repair protein RecN [Bryobacterales bacterium]|nr:replication and repair protein RecN [Bryobacterales bacterium]